MKKITLFILTLAVCCCFLTEFPEGKSDSQQSKQIIISNESVRFDDVEEAIPGGWPKVAIQQAQSDHNKLANEVREAIEQLLYEGIAMERYRKTDALAALRTCGIMMREKQAKAKAISLKAARLPVKYIYLKSAASDVYLCVSCMDSALESCDLVRELLDEGELYSDVN